MKWITDSYGNRAFVQKWGTVPGAPIAFGARREYGATVRARRVGSGVTLRRCVEVVGTTMNEWSMIERGARPMTETERERFDRLTRRSPACERCWRSPGPAPFNRYGEPDGNPHIPLGPIIQCERCGVWLCPDCIDTGECCVGEA